MFRFFGGVIAALAAGQADAEQIDCLMDPAQVIEVGSSVPGLLDAVYVERGEDVVAGRLLARLNNKVEAGTVDLLRLRATTTTVIDAQTRQMEMINKRHERISNLRDQGLATEEALDQVEAELITSQSLLAQAELDRDLAIKELARAEAALGQREIVSPISGVIADRNLSAGEYIGQDDYLVQIVQLDPLKIEAFVPIAMFGKITVDDIAQVAPAAPLAGKFAAKVTVVDQMFDAASGTFVVQLELPNPGAKLPAGHRCTLDFSGVEAGQ
jgi:RND family efflux transporter MFP subunit